MHGVQGAGWRRNAVGFSRKGLAANEASVSVLISIQGYQPIQTIYRLSDSLSYVPFRIVDGENVHCVSQLRRSCIRRSTANFRLQYREQL